MTFSMLCSGVLILALVFSVSAFFGLIYAEKGEHFTVSAWVFCAFGFAVCLTLLLIQNEIIK